MHVNILPAVPVSQKNSAHNEGRIIMHNTPDTSLTAYRRIQRTKAAAVRDQVREYITSHPMCTADDVMRAFIPAQPCFTSRETFLAALKVVETARKRLNELVSPNVGDVKLVDIAGVSHYRIREAAE
jgi:hypothetical protein